MGAASFFQQLGNDMGAGTRQAMYSWTRGDRWKSMQPGAPLQQRQLGTADVNLWKRPGDGRLMVISVSLLCPNCQFPFQFKPKDGEEFNVDDDERLHYRGRVECPARWPEYRNGVPTGNWVLCGWKAAIIEGRCHQIAGPDDPYGRPTVCPCVNPNVSHSPSICRCGGYPTDDERARLINGG